VEIMKYQYDLQIHSDLSDGDWPIERVMFLAKKRGLEGISITDHNTWLWFKKKKKLAQNFGLQYIQGVEISTKLFQTEVHILGYAKNFNIHIIKAGLKKTINGYNQRARQMIKKLREAKITNISYRDVKKNKGTNLAITKYDIARAIAPQLNVSPRQAQKLLNTGGVAYVPYGKWAMTPMVAIHLVQRAGGVAVLAHPGETHDKLIKKFGDKEGDKKFNTLLNKLIENRLNGIEIYSPKNNTVVKKFCLKIARRYSLVVTGGSDWHGEKHHPELKMGDGGLTVRLFQKLLTAIKENAR